VFTLMGRGQKEIHRGGAESTALGVKSYRRLGRARYSHP
jgi:hypothetical protein